MSLDDKLRKLRGWLDAAREAVLQEAKRHTYGGRFLSPQRREYVRGQANAFKQAMDLVDRVINEEE